MHSEAATVATEYAHVVRTEGMLGGEPRLAGTRIRVRDVAAARDTAGLAPEEIAAIVYPDLTLGQIYAALAYYEDHRAEIDEATQAESRRIEQFRRDHPGLVHDARGAARQESLVLKGYADHHVVFAIVQALRSRGMDVVTAAESGEQQADDAALLAHAFANQRVMLTNDADFLALAADHAQRHEVFAPLFFWPQQQRGIGEMMRSIIREATTYAYDEACSRVFYL